MSIVSFSLFSLVREVHSGLGVAARSCFFLHVFAEGAEFASSSRRLQWKPVPVCALRRAALCCAVL